MTETEIEASAARALWLAVIAQAIDDGDVGWVDERSFSFRLVCHLAELDVAWTATSVRNEIARRGTAGAAQRHRLQQLSKIRAGKRRRKARLSAGHERQRASELAMAS